MRFPEALVDGSRVSGFMLCDLKFQELEDSSEGVVVGCRDHHASTSWRFLKLVANFVFQLFNNRNAWRGGVVDKHRNRKVAAGEGLRDVRQVHPDGVAGGCVHGIGRFDLNYTAVRAQ